MAELTRVNMSDVMMEPQEELQKQQTKPTDAEFSEELLRIYYGEPKHENLSDLE